MKTNFIKFLEQQRNYYYAFSESQDNRDFEGFFIKELKFNFSEDRRE